MRRSAFWAALAVFLSGAASGAARDPRTAPVQQPPADRLLVVAREIMQGARYCGLVTLNEAGGPEARTIDPFSPGDDMVVWFATNPKSRKVRQIQRDPRVALHYFDAQALGYVTIIGTARVVDDAAEKKKRWKDGWEAFYPDRDRSYLLVAVTPERIEVVSTKHGIAGDPVTWTPPSVRVPRRVAIPG